MLRIFIPCLILIVSSFALGDTQINDGGTSSTSAREILSEESKPLAAEAAPAAVVPVKADARPAVMLAIFAALCLVGGAVGFKYFRREASRSGARRYLIEPMSYCPIGPGGKVGVGLVKVGSEFVLLGVTPTAVSLLSTLPRLEAQYQEEGRFERDVFKSAVEEELGRLRPPEMNA